MATENVPLVATENCTLEGRAAPGTSVPVSATLYDLFRECPKTSPTGLISSPTDQTVSASVQLLQTASPGGSVAVVAATPPRMRRLYVRGSEPRFDMTRPSCYTILSRAEPSRAEPSRAEPSRAEPSRAEPSRAEPSRAEPSRAEPSRAEPSRAEPSRAEPSRAEPSRAEPSRAEPSRAEPSRAEPSRAEPSRAEPSRAEPSRAEPSRAEPSRAEPSRAEPSRAEPSRAVELPTSWDGVELRSLSGAWRPAPGWRRPRSGRARLTKSRRP